MKQTRLRVGLASAAVAAAGLATVALGSSAQARPVRTTAAQAQAVSDKIQSLARATRRPP